MKGEVKYELGQNAYLKLVLHALKHKHSPVNGVLVGRCTGDGDVVEIRDAVPLFHSNQIGLLPSLEIALMQIEEHYGSQGLSLVGYFHANERFDDYELSNVAKNIGDHIYRYFPQAAVLLLDNRRLEALPKAKDQNPVMQGFHHSVRDSEKWLNLILDTSDSLIPLAETFQIPSHDPGNILYTRDASRTWRLVGSEGSAGLTIKEPTANIVLLDHISSGKWEEVVDFDDHLNDISKDWLNTELFK